MKSGAAGVERSFNQLSVHPTRGLSRAQAEILERLSSNKASHCSLTAEALPPSALASPFPAAKMPPPLPLPPPAAFVLCSSTEYSEDIHLGLSWWLTGPATFLSLSWQGTSLFLPYLFPSSTLFLWPHMPHKWRGTGGWLGIFCGRKTSWEGGRWRKKPCSCSFSRNIFSVTGPETSSSLYPH